MTETPSSRSAPSCRRNEPARSWHSGGRQFEPDKLQYRLLKRIGVRLLLRRAPRGVGSSWLLIGGCRIIRLVFWRGSLIDRDMGCLVRSRPSGQVATGRHRRLRRLPHPHACAEVAQSALSRVEAVRRPDQLPLGEQPATFMRHQLVNVLTESEHPRLVAAPFEQHEIAFDVRSIPIQRDNEVVSDMFAK